MEAPVSKTGGPEVRVLDPPLRPRLVRTSVRCRGALQITGRTATCWGCIWATAASSSTGASFQLVVVLRCGVSGHHRGSRDGDDADAARATSGTQSTRCPALRPCRCLEQGWPEAFPQHGPGRKHHRRIELAGWQREIVDRFPREFLRGLLHSDGCRTVNRFTTLLPSGRIAEYAYPRWFFSNRSADIRGCSASTASGSGSAGRSRTRATSRSRIGRASRSSTRSCRRSREQHGVVGRFIQEQAPEHQFGRLHASRGRRTPQASSMRRSANATARMVSTLVWTVASAFSALARVTVKRPSETSTLKRSSVRRRSSKAWRPPAAIGSNVVLSARTTRSRSSLRRRSASAGADPATELDHGSGSRLARRGRSARTPREAAGGGSRAAADDVRRARARRRRFARGRSGSPMPGSPASEVGVPLRPEQQLAHERAGAQRSPTTSTARPTGITVRSTFHLPSEPTSFLLTL